MTEDHIGAILKKLDDVYGVTKEGFYHDQPYHSVSCRCF